MRSLAIFILLMAGCSVGTKPSSDSWLSSKGSIAQKWQMFAAQNPSEFMTRCVAPMMEYPPRNGRYLEVDEERKLLLKYMLDGCFEDALINRSDPIFTKLKYDHFYSWGFRLYFGNFSNLTKLTFIKDLSEDGGDLSEDLNAAEIISRIWAQDGHTDSAFLLASLLLTKDPSASFKLTKDVAITGNCFAQAHLAYSYATGIGVEADPVSAFFWYSTTQGKRGSPQGYYRRGIYPASTNFYPAPLKKWFDEKYRQSRNYREPPEEMLGIAIQRRSTHTCGLYNYYEPLPSSIASAVKSLSNQWLVGQQAPEALAELNARYRQEAFAREALDQKSTAPIPQQGETESDFTNFERLYLELDAPSALSLQPDMLFASVSESVFPVYSAISKSSMSRGRASSGSAVHVSDNHFLTNCHIFEGNSFHLLRVEDEFLELKLTATDFERDICIFTVEEDLGLPSITVKSSSDLRVGEPVYAIGNPSGLQRTLSNGLVSAKRQINSVKLIQTNTEISGGSSGGGLFDQFGNLVGVTTFGIQGKEGLNFAIAVEEFLELP